MYKAISTKKQKSIKTIYLVQDKWRTRTAIEGAQSQTMYYNIIQGVLRARTEGGLYIVGRN